MVGMELVVGYVCAYLVGKARRAAGAADVEVDRAMDVSLAKMHNMVSRALGEDPALARAAEEAAGLEGEVSTRTRRRLADALDEAADSDSEFAAGLARAIAQVLEAEGPTSVGIAGGDGMVIGGGTHLRADHGSAAALRMGDVHMGNPPVPGAQQG